MHVDGFRFDLASVLSRDEDGQPVPRPPIIWDIETDPVLAGTKLIAEAWDAGGPVPGRHRSRATAGCEWNGRFRDDVRSFVKGDPGRTWAVAQRLLASPDIYGATAIGEPQKTINFVTCHDGFTLNDVVSYDREAQRGQRRGQPRRQRPEPELELRRRGADRRSRRSRRCAARQVKNLLALELLAVGVPMLHDGRRGPTDAARQQQRLLPGRASSAGSTGRSSIATRTCSASAAG